MAEPIQTSPAAPQPPKKQQGFFTRFLKRRTGSAPLDIPADTAKDLKDPQKRLDLHKRMMTAGSVFSQDRMAKLLQEALATSYYRRTFYRECELAASHPLVSGALDIYTDTCCGISPLNNRVVWVTSEDKKIENTLNQFLDEIGTDEKIRDWAGQEEMFGDMFVEVIGREGVGIAYVDDNIHPADIERIDINGRLEGFVRTGLYTERSQFTADLEAPWKYVHFRIFGTTKKVLNTALGIFGEPGKMFSLERERMGERKFRITTKYGVSLLVPVIPIYKRLKLCEDSVLLARITRGMLWYLYKIKIAGGNMDQAAELVQEYAEYLKRNLDMGLNTSDTTKEWKDKFLPMLGQAQDLFVPESEDISVTMEKMGGEPDIKAIVDVEMLTNQLLGSLRVSKAMLGITDELPGSIGEGAANRISINFAKSAQRVQGGMRNGIKRMCQIHLAYRKMNPDPTRFEVHFAEISSAEEEELKNALETGVDVADKLVKLFKDNVPDLDTLDVLNYCNQKILKLNDLDFEMMKKSLAARGVAGLGTIGNEKKDAAIAQKLYEFKMKKMRESAVSTDCMGYLPDIATQQASNNAMDESLKVLISSNDNQLNEEQRQLKDKILHTHKVIVFRVDEADGKIKEEKRSWEPVKITFVNEVKK